MFRTKQPGVINTHVYNEPSNQFLKCSMIMLMMGGKMEMIYVIVLHSTLIGEEDTVIQVTFVIR